MESICELQARSCSKDTLMIEVVHSDQLFALVAMLDSIRIILNLDAAQGKHVYILDIKNLFQNTIEFEPKKSTYNTLPPFFVEYIQLCWATHPDLGAVETDHTDFVVQIFCPMQGQKGAGHKFYQIIYNYLRHIGLHRMISDHRVFIWKQEESEMFLALATDVYMVLCDVISHFLNLKTKMEAMFEVTLQQGAILHFFNLHIIHSPAGIIIYQTAHIFETIVEPFYKNHDISLLLLITSSFPTDASFEQRLYEAPVLTCTSLRII
jgi:hypothetical protein